MNWGLLNVCVHVCSGYTDLPWDPQGEQGWQSPFGTEGCARLGLLLVAGWSCSSSSCFYHLGIFLSFLGLLYPRNFAKGWKP